MDFPRTVDEITPEWLTQVLRESGVNDGVSVASFEATNVGDTAGVAGVVTRLELLYNRTTLDAPSSVIVKQAVADDEMRAITAPLNHIEARFFNELASSSGFPTPRSYFSESDRESGYVVHVLEDLGHLRPANPVRDVELPDAQSALRSLAIMHARWWNDGRLLDHQWLRALDQPETIDWIMSGYGQNLDGFLRVAEGHIPIGIEEIANKLRPAASRMYADFAKPPFTLIHGDFKPANLFFDDSSTKQPVVAFDWQLAGRSNAADDLAQFITLGFSTETRRVHERQLLAEYHSQLVDGGVEDYSYDELIEHFRIALLARLPIRLTVIAKFGENMIKTEEGRKTFFSMVERLQTLIDWNCDEVIPK